MASNSNISLINLEPAGMANNLEAYLSTQSVFRDYNFEGSTMSVVVDLMARNSFLMAFLVNMGFSETFMDSAQLRDSLVSRSKDVNYTPLSVVSSSTILNVDIQTNNLSSFQLPM